jgi:hypothetical protein
MEDVADATKCDCGKPATKKVVTNLRGRHALLIGICDACQKQNICGCGKPATGQTFGILEGLGVPSQVCEECGTRLTLGEKTVSQVIASVAEQLAVEKLDGEGLHITSWASQDQGFFGQKAKDLKYRWIACYAVTGGSEGWYVHIDLVLSGYDDKMQATMKHLALCKTFEGRAHAYAIAARAAALLGA